MKNLVLVSDDKDFFDYVNNLLELKESKDTLLISFDEITNNFHLIKNSILLINSESSKEKTVDLLKIFKHLPIIVFAYNEDENYKIKCYENGAFDYITLLEANTELKLKITSALKWQELLVQNNIYHSLLTKKNIITKNSKIYIDYNDLLDITLEEIKISERMAVFIAIAPDDKIKYFINTNQLQTIILNNVKQSDIVMNYATNKYFIIMFDTDTLFAQKYWDKIFLQFPQKIHMVFCPIRNQSREVLVNEALNKLHQKINRDNFGDMNVSKTNTIKPIKLLSEGVNFKTYKQQFIKNFDNIVIPIFYQYQQKYNCILNGFSIKQSVSGGKGYFNIEGFGMLSSIQISSPGFSKINIDITLQKNKKVVDSKRITLEPSEMEEGLLNDIMEQYFIENKNRFLAKI